MLSSINFAQNETMSDHKKEKKLCLLLLVATMMTIIISTIIAHPMKELLPQETKQRQRLGAMKV